MTDTPIVEPSCAACAKTPPGFFEWYPGFLLSPATLITAGNALLLLAGFVVGLAGRQRHVCATRAARSRPEISQGLRKMEGVALFRRFPPHGHSSTCRYFWHSSRVRERVTRLRARASRSSVLTV